MLAQQDLDKVSSLIEGFKPKLGYFEKQILVPGMIGRLEYVIEIFKFFQSVCQKTDAALNIDAPLRNLCDPRVFHLGAPEPKVGQQYLTIIERQCEDDFIKPARKILADFSVERATSSLEELVDFLNATSNFMQSIAGSKERLFLYSLRSFVSVKDTRSGNIEVGPPMELTLVLMPFQTRLDELGNVAAKTIESIEGWTNQLRNQKARHVDVIVNLSHTKAAEEQARSARFSIIFQVAVIVFTIILVYGAEKMNLFMETRELEKSVTTLEGKLAISLKSEADLKNLVNVDRKRLRDLQDEVIKSRAVSLPPKKE